MIWPRRAQRSRGFENGKGLAEAQLKRHCVALAPLALGRGVGGVGNIKQWKRVDVRQCAFLRHSHFVKNSLQCGTTENCFCNKMECVAKCLIVGGLAKNQSLRFSKSFLPIPLLQLFSSLKGKFENHSVFIIKSFLQNLSQMCSMKQWRWKIKNR